MNYHPMDCTLYINGVPLTGFDDEDLVGVGSNNKLRITDMSLCPDGDSDYEDGVVKVESAYITFYIYKDSESYERLIESDSPQIMINYKGESLTDKELYMKLIEENA